MQTIIRLFVLLLATSSLAQRVEFNDPDLTFSFKKPKSWELIDDGYVVKVSPTVADTASIYVSFTYFQSPSAIDYTMLEADTEVPTLIPMNSVDEYNNHPESGEKIKIAKEEGRWSATEVTENGIVYVRRIYHITTYGQRWDIVTNVPKKEENAYHKKLLSIVKSLKVSN